MLPLQSKPDVCAAAGLGGGASGAEAVLISAAFAKSPASGSLAA